ncbi:hypothetical protein PS2_015192 [Malus domestica]
MATPERGSASDNITQTYPLNANEDTIIARGREITEYDIESVSGFYCTGRIRFEDNQSLKVRFLKFDNGVCARKTFSRTCKCGHSRILKPYFVTYCKPMEAWIICYQWFDHLLGDQNLRIPVLANTRFAILHYWWRNEIRELLGAIKHIHFSRCFHRALNEICNFVVVSNKILIVNVQGSIEELENHLDFSMVRAWRLKDLAEFKDLLKFHILEPGTVWFDRDYFLDFFDSDRFGYDNFIKKLISHPFVLEPRDRMMLFFTIDRALKADEDALMEFQSKLQGPEFYMYKRWNNNSNIVLSAYALEEIYNYRESGYDGESIWELFRFLRDVCSHSDRRITDEEADVVVRNVYPNFLDKVQGCVSLSANVVYKLSSSTVQANRVKRYLRVQIVII